jgi:hypothetical protein
VIHAAFGMFSLKLQKENRKTLTSSVIQTKKRCQINYEVFIVNVISHLTVICGKNHQKRLQKNHLGGMTEKVTPQ